MLPKIFSIFSSFLFMFKLKLLFFFPSIGVLVLNAGFCFDGPFLSSADISISSYFFLLMVCILLFSSFFVFSFFGLLFDLILLLLVLSFSFETIFSFFEILFFS
jgi:hypothetical protein